MQGSGLDILMWVIYLFIPATVVGLAILSLPTYVAIKRWRFRRGFKKYKSPM